VKKPNKLAIKKVTLRDLDEASLNKVAGGSILGGTCNGCFTRVGKTCPIKTCVTA